MAKIDIVDSLRAESETLWGSTDPFDLPVPTSTAVLERGKKSQVTGNQTFLAAVTVGLAAPLIPITLGPGFEGDATAGWGREGETLAGLEIAERALKHYAEVGLHGRKEPWGYGLTYGVGHLLATRLPDELQWMAQRLWRGWLAVYDLLTVRGSLPAVHPVGCRTEGGEESGLTMMQEIRGSRIPGGMVGPYYTLPRMIWRTPVERRDLLWLPSWPRPIEEIVRDLQESGVRCAVPFHWFAERGGASWVAGFDELSHCTSKGGESMCVRAVDGEVEHISHSVSVVASPTDWHLELTRSGLIIHRQPGGVVIPVEPEPPSPEELEPAKPEPPKPTKPAEPGQPTPEEIQRAREIIKEVKAMLKDDPRTRTARRRLHDALVALKEKP